MTDQPGAHLDQMTTRWSLVCRAGDVRDPSAAEARQALVMRYAPAVRSYLGGLTGNQQQADDLAQEVMVRLLRGDYAGADPSRGRFRDFLKVCIRNLVRNEWRAESRSRAVSLDVTHAVADDSPEDDESWVRTWRNNVLDLAWAALQQYEAQHPGNLFYTVLRLRTELPDASSQQLADALSATLGRAVRADSLRQTLKRAREKFAELLVEELAHGMAEATPERIEDELIALGLYEYVKDFAPFAWQRPSASS